MLEILIYKSHPWRQVASAVPVALTLLTGGFFYLLLGADGLEHQILLRLKVANQEA